MDESLRDKQRETGLLKRSDPPVMDSPSPAAGGTGRLTALNQVAEVARGAADEPLIMKATADGLARLGLNCVIVKCEPGPKPWMIKHISAPQAAVDAFENRHQVPLRDLDLSLADDPSLEKRLVRGEAVLFDGLGSAGEAGEGVTLESLVAGMGGLSFVLAPLQMGGHLSGALVVWGETVEKSLPVVMAFANQLAISLDHARLYDESLARAHRSTVLNQVAAATGAAMDQAGLLERTGSLLMDVLGLQACVFSRYDPSRARLFTLYALHSDGTREALPERPENRPTEDGSLSVDQPTRQEVLRGVRPSWIRRGDSSASSPELDSLRELGVGADLLIPMTAGGAPLGLAEFYWKESDITLSGEEMDFLLVAVEQVTMALERLRLATDAQRQLEIEQALAAVVEQTLASRDVHEVVETALYGVAMLLPCDRVSMTRFNVAEGSAEVLGVLGNDADVLPAGEVVTLKAWGDVSNVLAGELVYFPNVSSTTADSNIELRLMKAGISSWASLPLIVGEGIIGALSIGSATPQAFTDEHLQLAQRFADHLAVALTNARLFEEAKRRGDELSALYDIALDIAGEQEFHPLLETSIQRACDLLRTEHGAIFLVDDVADELRLAAGWNMPKAMVGTHLRKGEGLAGYVWSRRKTVIVSEGLAGREQSGLLKRVGQGAAMGVPLVWAGVVRGVLVVFDPNTGRRFSQEEAQLLERLAAQVAIGLENVRQHQSIRRHLDQLSVVNDLGRRITGILDQEELFRDVVRRIAYNLNIEVVVLFTLERDELVEAASYYLVEDVQFNWPPHRLNVRRGGISAEAAMSGEPVLVPDVDRHLDYVLHLPIEARVQSAVAVPLKSKGRVVGVLLVESERLAAFDESDVAALQALGAHISTAIENTQLYAESQRAQARLAESEKLRALGLMTSGIAHDFNNLLSVILSRSELVLKQVEGDGVRADLEQIVRAAREGRKTIERLQDFARTRGQESEYVPVDLEQVVADALELSRPRWNGQERQGGAEILVETDLNSNRPVLGSPAELRDALINLIFNAVEAMPSGGTLHIGVETTDQEAVLIVSDTGIGMTEEVKKEIFIPFFSTKEEGIGMGLSTVYGAVQRHSGHIEVDSVAGEGTTVRVHLPMPSEREEEGEGEEGAPWQEPSTEPANILVVEDDDAIREGLVEIFESAGHKVVTATDGEEALERFRKAGGVQVVFTDLLMPNCDGWELIEALRSLDSEVSIVVLSGLGDNLDQKRAAEHGVNIVLTKPFTISQVMETLDEAIKARLNGRELES